MFSATIRKWVNLSVESFGFRSSEVDMPALKSAAVSHFSRSREPVGFDEVCDFVYEYVMFDI